MYRRFGVEIEHNFPGGVYEAQRCLIDNEFHLWTRGIHRDASLHRYDGVEIRSPILQGYEGFKELQAVFSLLKENGGYVDDACGMHIHHDAPEFVDNIDNVKRLVWSWYQNQSTIEKFVNDSRIYYNDNCSPWRENELHQFEYIQTIENVTINRGKNLNIRSLYRHGTIEVRLHEGTLEFDEAEAWIKFGQKFIKNILNRVNPMPPIEETDLLLKRVKVNSPQRKILNLKAERR